MKFLSLRHQGSRVIPYEFVWDLQKELVQKRINEEIEDTILFVEHTPTVTRGRGLQWTGKSRERQMPLGQLPPGTSYFEVERGGDLTWHGPGQLVIYPIMKLDGKNGFPSHDVTGFLRGWEKVLTQFLSEMGISAGTRVNATGVWVGDRKLISMGIAVSKWVTYHGMALNGVNPSLSFQGFHPCGFSPEVMVSLKELLGEKFETQFSGERGDWRSSIEIDIERTFRNLFEVLSRENSSVQEWVIG